MKIRDHKFKVQNSVVLLFLQACSDIQVHAQSKQNDELNQVWHFARQVLKALEESKEVKGLYKGVIKVINHGGQHE